MNEVVFKTAVMGGFNKEDVLAFIDRQDAQFRAREQELVTRLNNMSAQYKNMSEEKDLVVYENNELKKQIQDEKNKTGQNSYQATLLKSELDKTKSDYEERLGESTEKQSQFESRISELEEELRNQYNSFDSERKSLQARIFDAGQSSSGLNTELESKNSEIAELTRTADEWKQKYEDCEARLNAYREQAQAELMQTKNTYESQIAQLRNDCDAQLAQLKSDYERKLAMSQNESDTFKNKLELIDKTEEQIGRALLEAQKTADNILSAANKKASDITSIAETNAASTEKRAREALSGLFSEADKKLQAMLDGAMSFKKRISDAQESAKEFFSEIGTILGCIESDAADICTGFAQTIGHEEMLLDKPQAEEQPEISETENESDTLTETDTILELPADFPDDNYLSEAEIRNAQETAAEDGATEETVDMISENDNTSVMPEGVSLEELEEAALGTTGMDCFSTDDLEKLDGISDDAESSENGDFDFSTFNN